MKKHLTIRRAAALVLSHSVLATSIVFAQTTRDLTRPAASTNSNTEARTALVIGNSAYKNASALANPVNDARDVSGALKELGFEVISGENLTAEQMKLKVTEFGQRLAQRKGVGLFFYAGHGVQINGRNYLIPVEAKALREQTIEFESLDVSRVLGEMDASGARLNMVILDACRNNPFERSWRSADQGLAEIRAPRGTLVAYATAPGKVAFDGTGRNGTFTSELLKLIREPNILVETLFKRVGERVSAVSGGTQEPYLSQSIRGDFYFSVSSDLSAPVANAPIVASRPAENSNLDAETLFWQDVSGTNRKAGYELYLSEYPRGKFVTEARARLDNIRRSEAAKAEEEERTAWTEALSLNRRAAVEVYLRSYPNGRFVSDARAKLVEFDKADERAKWQEAEGVKTEAAYRGYLNLYPKGEFAALAKLRLANMGIVLGPPREARGGTPWKTESGMELVFIPAGEFLMGSTDADIKAVEDECKLSASNCTYKTSNEGPVRRVSIREGFWMGKHEVTQGQWRALMGDNPSYFKQCGDNCPVETVSWEDAKRFIAKLNERNDGFVYTLPTEAEWEYAARAGTTGVRYGSLDDVAWYADNAGNRRINSIQMWLGDSNWDNYSKSVIANGNRTRAVGGKTPNAWGLHDMLGNVYEWVEDIYKEDGYGGLPTDGSANVTRGDSSKRVLRGGSWFSYGNNSRSALRSGSSPSVRFNYGFGFRVVARPR